MARGTVSGATHRLLRWPTTTPSSTPGLDRAPLDDQWRSTSATRPTSPRAAAWQVVHRLGLSGAGFPAALVAAVATFPCSATQVSRHRLARFTLYWAVSSSFPARWSCEHCSAHGLGTGGVGAGRLDRARARINRVCRRSAAWAPTSSCAGGGSPRTWCSLPSPPFATTGEAPGHLDWHRPQRGHSPRVGSGRRDRLAVLSSTALSPTASAPYVDHWFHLSIINEFMRPGPHVVPRSQARP